MVNLPIDIQYYPKNLTKERFGYATIKKKNFLNGSPTTVLCLFHGAGEVGDGSMAALQKMATWAGWYVDEKNPSLFGAVNKWNFCIVMVQTEGDSRFGSGEIDFAVKMANRHFIPIGRLVALGLSLGGYGLLNYGNNRADRLLQFSKMMFVMPGGNGGIGGDFAAAAVKAELPCRFFHADDDNVALPGQSIMINAQIKKLGGDSELLLYVDGKHTIAGRVFNAYFPWASWNMTTAKVVPGFFLPAESIYAWMTAMPVVPDVLLYKQAVYQRPNGTVYAVPLPLQ